jgi:hypothetical protein
MALASTSCAAAALLAPAAAASTQTATRALRLLTTIGLLRFAASLVPVTNTMSTFDVAIKGRRCECDEPAPEPRAPPNVSQYYLSAQGARPPAPLTASRARPLSTPASALTAVRL